MHEAFFLCFWSDFLMRDFAVFCRIRTPRAQTYCISYWFGHWAPPTTHSRQVPEARATFRASAFAKDSSASPRAAAVKLKTYGVSHDLGHLARHVAPREAANPVEATVPRVAVQRRGLPRTGWDTATHPTVARSCPIPPIRVAQQWKWQFEIYSGEKRNVVAPIPTGPTMEMAV